MHRVLTLALLELKTAWRRPSLWVFLAILIFLTWGFSAGTVSIGAGSRVAGGERTFLNSEFNLAYGDILVFTLFYVFFACTAFGNAPSEDDALRIMPIVGSTGLTPGQYVLGRWLGIAIVYTAIVLVHLVIQVGFYELYPLAEPEKLRGPFSLVNYVRPMALFVLLPMLSLGAVSFAIGAVTRQAVLVFALPVAILLANIFFLWDFAPEWLPHWGNRLLQAVDITGFRWLLETWIKVDRGADFYNSNPLSLDGLMSVQRIVIPAVGAAALARAAWRERTRMRAPHAVPEAARSGIIAASDRAQRDAAARPRTQSPLAALGMAQGSVGWLAAMADAFRAEARELRRSPGLWVFVPLIVIQCIGAVYTPGAFDTPNLTSAGTFVGQTYNTVTLLSLLMVLYYFTESLARDDRSRIASLVNASAVSLAPLGLGRMLACAATVVLALLGAVWIALAVALAVQWYESGIFLPPSPMPFLVGWGALMSATLFAWMCFLALAWSLFRNRYAVYGAGLAALILTGWCVRFGWMNWVFNWMLWDGLIWTDFGALELDRGAMVLNRLLWVLAGLTMLHAAIEWWRRRAPDAQGITSRLQWSRAWRRCLRMLVFGGPAIACAVVLAVMVRQGEGGGPERERTKQYYVGNANTWKDAPTLTIMRMDLDLDLEPADGNLRVKGTYGLRNETDAPLRQFSVTPNTTFRDVAFTFEGKEWTRESAAEVRRKNPRGTKVVDNAGLWVFTPATPIAPGADIELGFRHEVRVPDGLRRNPAGAGQFILPSGTVLAGFGPTFLPEMGYIDGVGLDPERTPEPKRVGPDDWKKVTKTAFGTGGKTMMAATIRVPEEYRVNMPGVCTADTVADGIRTMRWETDHPIMAANIVAGRWQESRGKASVIWHLPQHGFNVPVMLEALDGAHEWYSKWFWPYPWKELRLNEFPGLAGYAQGFPTNITFSESIGFMSKPTAEQDTPFMVTAHEAAHQWFGNILRPGIDPGGNILSEGMAHYASARLIRQVRGERMRMAFMRGIEFGYGNARSADDELPMTETDGSRSGDTTVTYDKGGWVFWMLMEHMGEERMDAAMREFIGRFKDGPDHPLL
ncbi:MAG: M1 family aminopeptidase, partial [Phycisphaerales bacterium]